MITRYELIQEPTDTWAIFEMDSGEPVMIEDRFMIGLTETEAQQIYAALTMPAKAELQSAAPVKAGKQSAA